MGSAWEFKHLKEDLERKRITREYCDDCYYKKEYKEDKVYTIDEIKKYAEYWLKPALSTDSKDNIIENERLQAFIYYINADDNDNIDNVLKKLQDK